MRMDVDDEIVETSDVEELEELQRGGGKDYKGKLGINEASETTIRRPPRKRMKLYHDVFTNNDDDLEEMCSSPLVRYQSSTVSGTPHMSQSSSTMLDAASPTTRIPVSPSRTPAIYQTKSPPSNKVAGSLISMSDLGNSQDPLLLHSPSRKLATSPRLPLVSISNTNSLLGMPVLRLDISTTPLSSPLGPRQRSDSPDPLALVDNLLADVQSSPSTSLRILPSSDTAQASTGADDGLMNFSPIKPASLRLPSTPPNFRKSPSISSQHSADTSPLSSSQSSPRHTTRSSISPGRQEPNSHPAPEIPMEHVQWPKTRYSLRTRNAAQLAPYTVEQFNYKQALRSNPEAIVKMKSHGLRQEHHHPEDRYEETQQEGFAGDDNHDEDADWEAKERRRLRLEELRRKTLSRSGSPGPSRVVSEQELAQYPSILQDPSTDEDQSPDSSLLKEAEKAFQKVARLRKAQAKAERHEQRERRREQQKLKTFPLPKRKYVSSRSPSPADHAKAVFDEETIDSNKMHQPIASGSGLETSQVYHRDRSALLAAPDDQAILDYFGQDDVDFNLEDQSYGIARHQEDHYGQDNNWSPPPRIASRRKSPETVIFVGSDAEQASQHISRSKRSDSPNESSDGEIQLSRAKKRALKRMFPKSMALALVRQPPPQIAGKNKRRASSALPTSGSDSEDGPLLPGQTRTRKAARLKDSKDIKGDTESEETPGDDSDACSSVSDLHSHRSLDVESGLELNGIATNSRRRQHRSNRDWDVIDIVSDSNPSSDEENKTSGQVYTNSKSIHKSKRRATNSTRLRDESLIDWMLTRTRTTGSNGQERKRVRSGQKRARDGSSNFKFDVTTRGGRKHGHERQTLLTFDGHETSRKRGYRPSTAPTLPKMGRSSKGAFPRTSERNSLDTYYPPDDVDGSGADGIPGIELEPVDGSSRTMTWKQRDKLRRARARKQGVYTFTSSGMRVGNRREARTAFMSVDLEDEGLHRALGPLSWAESFSKPQHHIDPIRARHPKGSNLAGNRDVAEPNEGQIVNKEKDKRHVIPADLDLPLLHSGKSFGPHTYIRKGLLHELVSVLTSARDPDSPSPITSRGFKLGPDMEVEDLTSMFERICDDLFEFATDLPDPDADILALEWSNVMRIVPRLVSWFRRNGDQSKFAEFREVAEKEISRLIENIQKLNLEFIDTPILATGWFAVEVCARLGCRLMNQPAGVVPEPLGASASMLMRLLLQIGVEKAMAQTKSNMDSHERSSALYAAELWVCLIHTLADCGPIAQPGPRQIHPFWSVLMDAVQICHRSKGDLKNLDASEDIWRTIFSVCAFSQFSVHGMTTGQPRLPSCWEFVTRALSVIRLKEDPSKDRGMPPKVLEQRDQYIALVTTRCFHLRERWHWKLDQASSFFSQLTEIFKSRKFQNLRHEGTVYPRFFKDKNWALLSSFDPRDTAFVTFLKLVVQAAQDDHSGKLLKKILSLTVPVGSLPFSKTSPPTLKQLTMFDNRLSAVAIAVYLKPDEYDSRTRQAREYINFANADYTTRCAVIRGIEHWAIMMVHHGVKLDAIAVWVEEIALVLEAELKPVERIPDPTSPEISDKNITADMDHRQRLCDLVNVVLVSVRHILTACIKVARYPNPSLLSCLKPILVSWPILRTDGSKNEVGFLATELFTARSVSMPRPARPSRTPATLPAIGEESQESQDYGAMDLNLDDVDWSAADLPPELVPGPSPGEQLEQLSSNVDQDKALFAALNATRYRWLVLRYLKLYIPRPPTSGSFSAQAVDCDFWLLAWLGCGVVDPKKWESYVDLIDKAFMKDPVGESWDRRLELSMMAKLLKLDPMAYLTYIDRALDAYLRALVSEPTALEEEYVPFLISIDGQEHPLLCCANCLPEPSPESGDHEFTSAQFLELRLPLIRVVLGNMDRLLREEQEGNIVLRSDNKIYMQSCQNMFSTMRSIHNSFAASDDSPERYLAYKDFCGRVTKSLSEYPELRVHEGLQFWITWPGRRPDE